MKEQAPAHHPGESTWCFTALQKVPTHRDCQAPELAVLSSGGIFLIQLQQGGTECTQQFLLGSSLWVLPAQKTKNAAPALLTVMG